MIIDVKNTKTYIISPGEGKYKSRLLTVFTRLVDAGFKNIHFMKSLPGPNNTASLTNTVLEIFKRELNNNEPFFILEDDCNFFHTYDIIEVPDTFDVLYVGVALWAYPYPVETLYTHSRPNVIMNSLKTVNPYNNTLVQVKAMTSGHSILYNSRDFMRTFIDNMNDISKTVVNLPHDLLFSALHPYFNVYAQKNPMFYQDSDLGGQENVTKITFNGKCYR